MKKYILLVIMPFVLQSSVFCKDQFADIDAIIINELRAAQKAMHSNTSLTLKTILHALVSFGRKAGNRASAIECIVRIQKALLVCKSEQYNPAWYDICGFFSSKPEMVTKQIEPALKEVDKAFKDLKITSSEYSFAFSVVKNVFVGVALVVGSFAAFGAGYQFGKMLRGQDSAQDSGYISLEQQYDRNLRALGKAALREEQAARTMRKPRNPYDFAAVYEGQFDQAPQISKNETALNPEFSDNPLVSGSVYDSLGSYKTPAREDESLEDAFARLGQAEQAAADSNQMPQKTVVSDL